MREVERARQAEGRALVFALALMANRGEGARRETSGEDMASAPLRLREAASAMRIADLLSDMVYFVV